MTEQPSKCSICLDPFVDEAKINGCRHTFCYLCIHTWSKTTNKCTMCLKKFTRIELVKADNKSKRRTRSSGPPEITRVKSVKQQATWDDEELLQLVAEGEGDGDHDGNFYTNSAEEESQDEYELNDGLVVADDAPIEYAEPSSSEDNEAIADNESSSGEVEIIQPVSKRRK